MCLYPFVPLFFKGMRGSFSNYGEHGIGIVFNLLVREAKNTQVSCSYDFVTKEIVVCPLLMDRSIYFYNQTGSMAVEIGNEAIYDLLAAKMKTIQAVITQI